MIFDSFNVPKEGRKRERERGEVLYYSFHRARKLKEGRRPRNNVTLSNRGHNNTIVTVINQREGEGGRRENGIRTNVYFNRATGNNKEGKKGWPSWKGRRKAELVIYGLVGPRGKFMVSQRLSPLDLFVTRYGPWARVTFQESLRACPRGWHALVTSYTDCTYFACLSQCDRNRIVM